MASPQHSQDSMMQFKRPSSNVPMGSTPAGLQVDRRRQVRADNVFTQIEDVTYAVLRRHQKSA